MNAHVTVDILLYGQDPLLSAFGGQLQTFHDRPGLSPTGWGKM